MKKENKDYKMLMLIYYLTRFNKIID